MRTARKPPRRFFRVHEPRGLDDTGKLLFAAHVMLAMDDVKRFGGMSSQDLKSYLGHIPGVEHLTMNYAPHTGNLLVTIGDRTVEVGPTASNADIAAAFAAPVTVSVPPAPVPTSAILPMPRLVAAPITQVSTPPMSITGAVNAGMTIKDLIAGSRTAVKKAHDKLVANAGKVNDAAAALDGLGDSLASEADDLMSMIGQFKNDLASSNSAPAAPAPAPVAATPAATPLPAAPTIAPAPPVAAPA
jgi:hypothetical protein